MIDPGWILIAIAVIQVILAAPIFFRALPAQSAAPAPSYIRLGLMLLTVLALWGAVVFYYYNPRFDPDAHLQKIAHRIYNNESVHLDGYEFLDCTFINVTFIYEGRAPFLLTEAHFPTKNNLIQFGSPNPEINLAIGFVETLHQAWNFQGSKQGFRFVPKEEMR